MKNLTFILISLSGLLLFLPVCLVAQTKTPAAKEHIIDVQLKACLNDKNNYTTAGMVTCTKTALDAWDKELNKYYKLLMSELNIQEKERLKTAQRNWLIFRDSENNFTNTMYQNMQGTMWQTVAINDRMELLKQRALQLKEYHETLTMK